MEKAPARIFVLWHPEFAAGRYIAADIFNWFRTPDGHGLPVYFRSAPDPNGDDDLPPSVPDSRDSLTFVILLAEFHMVRDRNWREWLTELDSHKSARTTLYPVALHRTAYKLPDPICKLNFITVQANQQRGADLNDQELIALLKSLRKSLTEVFSRALGHKLLTTKLTKFMSSLKDFFLQSTSEPPKIKVFISHAKRDRHAIDISKRIRDYIYQETQLTAFFDENDIALGYRFGEVLDQTLKSGVAAMIAVNSDSYAARPWCRREIQVFSRPTVSKAHDDVWEKRPMLVLQAMEGGQVTSAIPDFGNSPMLRWRDGDETLCIDTLLREAIFRAYHAAMASIIRKDLKRRENGQNAPQRKFINWVPDPLSLNSVVQGLHKSNSKDGKPIKDLEIVYPGGGLSFVELQSLYNSFPQIRLRSFSEIRADWGSQS